MELDEVASTSFQRIDTMRNKSKFHSITASFIRRLHLSQRPAICRKRDRDTSVRSKKSRATIDSGIPSGSEITVFRYDYKNNPIDSTRREIRLLEVQAGESTDPVKCLMRTTCLGSKKMRSYETVSYCWGANSGEDLIEIDGLPVKTTRSAAEALRRLRSRSKNRTLWIDAICINQGIQDYDTGEEKNEEKNAQVKMMGDIYRNTTRNLVYLGQSRVEIGSLNRCISSLLDDVRVFTEAHKDLWTATHTADGRFRTDGNSVNQTIDLAPIHAVFACPWFQRRWVVQEAGLAPLSLCYFGATTFSLVDILQIALWLNFNSDHILWQPGQHRNLEAASCFWYITDRYALGRFKRDLYGLCNLFRHTRASNHADYLYALLGMLQTRGIETHPHVDSIVVNYNRPAQDIFRDATRALIEDTKLLNILREIDAARDQQPHFASNWVYKFGWKPDASELEVSEPEASHLAPEYLADCSTFIQHSTIPADGNMNVLLLRGIELDQITHCSAFPYMSESPQHPNNAVPFLRDAQDCALRLSEGEPSLPQELIMELAYTLIAEHNWQQRRANLTDVEDFQCFLDYVNLNAEVPPGWAPLEVPEDTDEKTKAAMRFHYVFDSVCRSRRFYITKYGRMGLGPASLQAGDAIVILFGGSSPFILRHDDDSHRHQYIGTTYLCGEMGGKQLKRRLETTEPKFEFLIT